MCRIYTSLFIIIISILSTKNFVFSQDCATKITSKNFKNLWKVSEDIYRSEQPNVKGFEELKKMGIATILNLRYYHSDKKYIEKNSSLNYLQVKLKAGKLNHDSVKLALKYLINSPKPILVHCKHGSDRTGLIIALYRIVVENRTKTEAINEMINCNYGFHKIYKNIIKYISNINLEELKNYCKQIE